MSRGKKTTENTLKVKMFGEFSIRLGDRLLTDDVSRIKKVWMLMEYLLVNRKSAVPQDKLIEVLWNDENSDNPVGALKNLIYRARSALRTLDEDVGGDLIQYATNAYMWSDELPIEVDAELFEELGRQAAEAVDENEKVDKYRRAIDLYRGSFLPKSSYAEWVMFKSTHYATLYNDYVLHTAQILHQQCRYEEMVILCEQAIEYDRFDERIHRYLMEGYAGTGQGNRALSHYNYVTNLFYKEFGVSLSEETKQQHKKLVEEFHNLEMDLSIIRDELKETYIQNKGAYFCDDYEVFKSIYRVQARMITRTGLSIHLGLITMVDRDGGVPEKDTLCPTMERLTECVLSGLRRGDIVWRCSPSQLVTMLPMTTYENCKRVINRLVLDFRKTNKRNDVELRTMICMVEPVEEG